MITYNTTILESIQKGLPHTDPPYFSLIQENILVAFNFHTIHSGGTVSSYDDIPYTTEGVTVYIKREDNSYFENVTIVGSCGNFMRVTLKTISRIYGDDIQSEMTNNIISTVVDYLENNNPDPCLRGLRAYNLVELATVIAAEIESVLALLNL